MRVEAFGNQVEKVCGEIGPFNHVWVEISRNFRMKMKL